MDWRDESFSDLNKQGFMKRAYKKKKAKTVYEVWSDDGMLGQYETLSSAESNARRQGGWVKKVRISNPLFGFLTSRKGYSSFKQTPRGKVTYHRSKKADRKSELKEARELGLGKGKRAKRVGRIISAGKRSKPRASDKDLLGLFGDLDFDRQDNPSKSMLAKGIKGTVRLVGKGRNQRLEIHT
jgi:hypothetical protein